MRLATTTLTLALLSLTARAEEERPTYCEEPDFIIRGEPERHTDPRDEDVLNPEEAADPALAQQLAASPGPYGHSELGFRYLARLFGYPGRFGSQKQVEDWVVLQEAENHALKKGLWQIWEKWVVKPPKRLSVPRGPVSALPLDGNPDMFFLDARDRLDHARCLKVELASQLCQNYEGRSRKFEAKDVVLFAGSVKGGEKYGYCQVRVPPWRKELEAKRAKEFVNGANLSGGTVTGAGAGTGTEGGKADSPTVAGKGERNAK